MIRITLPWPPALLSGHANTNGSYAKRAATKKLRADAHMLAVRQPRPSACDGEGDIALTIRFHAPDNRGDRTNFPTRVKGAIDGVADAWGVNDRRFLPTWEYGEPVKGGAVVVEVAE